MTRIPLWLKVGFTAWFVLWAPVYWRAFGPQNFLWFCDLGNLFVCAALWGESRLIFSWQAVSLLLVQTAWIVDFAGRILVGVHPIGGSEYMFDGSIPLAARALSLFHGAMPFLLVWGVRRFGYDGRALALQTLTAWIVLPICFFCFGPDKDINWVWGPFDHPQTRVPPGLYFVGCMILYPAILYLPAHLLLRRYRDEGRHRDSL